jgi:hypothetical protein
MSDAMRPPPVFTGRWRGVPIRVGVVELGGYVNLCAQIITESELESNAFHTNPGWRIFNHAFPQASSFSSFVRVRCFVRGP